MLQYCKGFLILAAALVVIVLRSNGYLGHIDGELHWSDPAVLIAFALLSIGYWVSVFEINKLRDREIQLRKEREELETELARENKN